MPDGGAIEINCENYLNKIGCALLPISKYIKAGVSDTGAGISESDIEKIFDPYFTTEIFRNSRGSGLGLSICELIIKKHGGYIAVQSELGKGTSFTIYFPIVDERGAQSTPAVKVIVASGYSNNPAMINYQGYGFIASISKPFQLAELRSLINQLMMKI